MRVEKLSIRGFRAITEMELEFHPRMNVLAGVNGAGKTSVLDCLSTMLSHFTSRLLSSKSVNPSFAEEDVTTDGKVAIVAARARIAGELVDWTSAKTRRGVAREPDSELTDLRAAVERLRDVLEMDEVAAVPLLVHYATNRAVLDIPQRVRTRHEFNRLSVYEEALSDPGRETRLDFRLFFEWFRDREDIENEHNVAPRGEPTLISFEEDRQLGAVRKAIGAFLPGFEDLRIRREAPMRMVLLKGKRELAVNQLSDGEKCLLALVGDLARRLAIANPGMDDPLPGEGVVLIDEIELHLHPKWQRTVLPTLKDTFPGCQFIVTTHSPQVLSHVPPESVILLKESEEGIVAARPDATYGQTSNRILEDVMGVPARPEEVEREFSELFATIDQGDVAEAKRKAEDLRRRLRKDPRLTQANMLIRRREIIGT